MISVHAQNESTEKSSSNVKIEKTLKSE